MPNTILNPFTSKLDFAGLSSSEADLLYIRLDGTSTTTASIPFAQGLSVGNGTTNYTFTTIVDGSWPDTTIYGQILVPSITAGGVKRVVPMVFGSEDTSAADILNFRYQLASREFVYGVGGDRFSWYLGQDGAFTTRGAVVISAVPETGTSVSGGDFELVNAFQKFADGLGVQSSMLGVRADVAGASVQINYNNPSGSDPTFFPLLIGPYQTGVDYAIGQGGAHFWGDHATTGAAGLNATGQSYSKYPVRDYTNSDTQIPFDLTMYRLQESILGVSGGIYANQDNAFYSRFGLAPDSGMLSPSDTIDQLVVYKKIGSGQARAAAFVAAIETSGTTTYTSSITANNGFAGTTSAATGNLTINATTNGGGVRVYRGLLDFNGTSITLNVTQASVYTGTLRLDVSGTTLTDASTYHSEGIANAGASTTLTRLQDFWIRDGAASSGTFTTRIGLRIDSLTRASNNYAIFIAGTSAGSGIYFNSSTAASKEFIYSPATNVLSINAGDTVRFDLTGGTEVSIAANTMTFNSGSSDPVLDWTTDGVLDMTTGTTKLSGGGTTRAPLNITTSAAPSSPNSGDIWHDSTQKSIQSQLAGVKQTLSTVVFTSTARASTSGTGESTIIGSGVGTTTLPANFFTAGKTIRVIVLGNIDTTGGGTATVKIKLGSTELTSVTTASYIASASNFYMEHVFYITCRSTGASGTVFAQGHTLCPSAATTIRGAFNVETATTTIDTTASQVIDVVASATGGGTGTVVHGDNVIIEALN